MTRQDVRDAYRQVRMTPEEKSELLEEIVEEAGTLPPDDENNGVKKQWLVVLGIAGVLCLGMLIACLVLGRKKPAEITQPSTEPASSATETVPLNGELPAEYAEKLTQLSQAVADKAALEVFQSAELSPLFANMDSTASIGYALVDLDGNGTKELLISGGDTLYNVFSLVDGQLRCVLSANERNQYAVTRNGRILQTEIQSVSVTYYRVMELSRGMLVEDTILLCQTIGENNQWFLGYEETEISETEAQDFFAEYAPIAVVWNLLPQ